MAFQLGLRRILRAAPLAAAVAVLLGALYLVASVEQEATQLGRAGLWVFLLTGITLVILAAVIVGRLVRLYRRVKKREPGARLTARLVAVFTALALPPVLIVYLFSLEFLTETVEGWLDLRTEQALADSIELGQLFLELRTREIRAQHGRLADTLATDDEERMFRQLLRRVSAAGPTELTVLDASGQTQLMVHIDPGVLVPDLPSDFALSQALQDQQYAAAEPDGDGRLKIRALTALPAPTPAATPLLLQAIYPLPDDFSALAGRIEQAYYDYENVAYLRDRLKQSFVLILSLVLLITALLALLLAFNAARRLVAPIRDLARATETMTAGRFPEDVPVTSSDELGFLVRSFNAMTRELASSQQQLENQRRYLETVLGRLSAGVLAIDGKGRLSAHNDSAVRILDVDLAHWAGRPLAELAADQPRLEPLVEAILGRAAGPGREWRREIQLGTAERPLVLMCRGSILPGEDRGGLGHVVVFDDVTELDQAQRDAAWTEVARRLAHEVKNPLTPIRLAAERLRNRLDQGLSTEQRTLIEKTTRTIMSQVDALKRLVDAFGDYARASALQLEPVAIDPLVRDVVDLYLTGDSGIRFDIQLAAGDASPRAEAGRMRQVLHNLIRNAQEAHPEGRPAIRIRTRVRRDGDGDWLELALEDDGPGFPPEVMARLFEPYVTTKDRGTGLGLAIVRRIIDEHGGRIIAANRRGGGARITIGLPLESRQKASPEFRAAGS